MAMLREAVLRHVRLLSDHAGGAFFLDKGQVTNRVLATVKHFPKVNPGKVSETSSFIGDLGLDSLDVVEIVMALEEEFALEIPDNEADKISSVMEAIEYISLHPRAK